MTNGAALCKAGTASGTDGEQYIIGVWDGVTCRRCLAILRADNRRDARDNRRIDAEMERLK